MQKISENSIRRRLKRRILNHRHQYFAVCTPGFEHVTKSEILGLDDVEGVWTTKGGVGFSAPLDTAYLGNMFFNSASRLLMRIREFSALSFPMLFDQMTRVEWELWIPDGGSYKFRVSVRSTNLNMRKRVIDTCKDAVGTRLTQLGLKAKYDANASMAFTIRLNENKATLSLDTSGDHLHLRGYKPYTVTAPIRETLACAILLNSHFYDYDLIVDPFCGSGTFLIEGARMSAGRPAGHLRNFGLGEALFFKEGKLDRLRKSVNETFVSSSEYFGFDVSEEAVRTAQMNVQESGDQGRVKVQKADVQDIDFNTLGDGRHRKLLITNPPYGKRLRSELADYQITDQLVRRLPGWTIAILSTRNLAMTQSVHSDTRQTISGGEVLAFSNGGIKTYLHTFDVE